MIQTVVMVIVAAIVLRHWWRNEPQLLIQAHEKNASALTLAANGKRVHLADCNRSKPVFYLLPVPYIRQRVTWKEAPGDPAQEWDLLTNLAGSTRVHPVN